MTELWLGLGLLVLLLVFVVLWPALRGAGRDKLRSDEESSKRAALASLYREQQAELQAARASGALDEQQFAQLETEMARNLLAAEASADSRRVSRGGRGLLIGLALVLPLLALGLYSYSGEHAALSLHRDIVASQSGAGDPAAETRITAGLKQRAQAHPEDLTSRYVLAQRLLASGDLAGAVKSYRYVVEREPQAAGVKAELAQALFFAEGSRINDEVRTLVQEVLAIAPDNGTALGLAGIGAFESGDYSAARSHWQRALSQLPPESAAAQALAAGVARAEKALADSNGLEPQVVADAGAVAGPSIRVSVSLGEGVSAAPDTPVFIYARGADSPMPLAIVRLRADQLPTEVVLDETRAMMPNRSIATVDSVQLVARLAVHGDARPAPGDWQGSVDGLAETEWDQPVSITIDREL